MNKRFSGLSALADVFIIADAINKRNRKKHATRNTTTTRQVYNQKQDKIITLTTHTTTTYSED